MQQEDADPLTVADFEDDSAATRVKLEKLTRLSDPREMSNFLSYGKWGLTDADIERIQKDDEMKQRVSMHPTIPSIQLSFAFLDNQMHIYVRIYI